MQTSESIQNPSPFVAPADCTGCSSELMSQLFTPMNGVSSCVRQLLLKSKTGTEQWRAGVTLLQGKEMQSDGNLLHKQKAVGPNQLEKCDPSSGVYC